MKKGFTHILRIGGLALALAVLSAGCGKENDGTENTGQAIGFQTGVEHSRAPETNANNIRSFRVSAVWDKGGSVYEPAFMDQTIVSRQSSADVWTYSPERYMPASGHVDFFAYSPALSTGVTSFTLSGSNYNDVSIVYDASTDPLQQDDFMVASALNRTSSTIPMEFQHILAEVGFQVRSADPGVSFTIRSIVLENLNSRATLTGQVSGNTTTWDWSIPSLSQPKDYPAYIPAPIYVAAGGNHVAVNDASLGGVAIIPQTTVANSGFSLAVTFDSYGFTPTDYTAHTINLPVFEPGVSPDTPITFVAGKKYTLAIALGQTVITGTRAAQSAGIGGKVTIIETLL